MKTSHYFNRIVESRLKECGLQNFDTFMSIIIKTQSVIAGSFPLQCILGEHYDNSDIDIFCLGIERDTCEKMMMEGKGGLPTLCEIDRHIYSTYSKKGQPNKYIVDGIIRSKIYNITDKLCFNVIQVAYKPFEFVKNTFDFTFCQTIYDGNNMHFYPLTLQKIGWRSHALLPKYKSKKKYHTDRPSSQSPFNEYPKNPAKEMLERYNKRFNKYKTRGFSIYDINGIAHLKLLFQECKIEETILPHDSLQLAPQLASTLSRNICIDNTHNKVNTQENSRATHTKNDTDNEKEDSDEDE